MRHFISVMMIAALLTGCGVKRSLKLPDEDKSKSKQESSVLQNMPGQNLPQPAATGGTTYTIEPK